jgi:hypothetical protein
MDALEGTVWWQATYPSMRQFFLDTHDPRKASTFAEKVSKLNGVTVIAPDGYVNYGWRNGQPQITGVSNFRNDGGFLTFRNGAQVGTKTSLHVALIVSQITATLKK